MAEQSNSGVAEILAQNGLNGPAFDPAEVADGLAGWREAGRELDRLLEDRTVSDVTLFDPEWR